MSAIAATAIADSNRPPGNHQIELRDSDGQTVYHEQVAVTVGKTTKLPVS